MMKREYDGDDNHPNRKRQRGDGFTEALKNGKFEIRFLVSSKSAGGIIGKGGENIKHLRADFDAHVTVPDSATPERVVTIVAAKENIPKIVEDFLSRLEEAEEKDPCELKILIHQSHAGALIGRSGSKIKELREKCNAKIKIYSNCCPMSTDRVLKISGEEKSCLQGISVIIDELTELQIKGNINQYVPTENDPAIVESYGGYRRPGGVGPPVNGGPGIGGPPPPRGGGGDYGYQRSAPPPPRRDNYGGGRPEQSYTNTGYAGYGGGGPGMPIGGGGGGSTGYAGFGNLAGGPIETAQVTIPSDLGGTIIGRRGDRIQRIRDESRAQITLESDNGQSERVITIRGTQDQIHAAQYLLQQCVRNSQQGRERFGGAGGPSSVVAGGGGGSTGPRR